MNKKLIVSPLAAALLLAGCSSMFKIKHECPLGENPHARCKSVQTAYDEALRSNAKPDDETVNGRVKIVKKKTLFDEITETFADENEISGSSGFGFFGNEEDKRKVAPIVLPEAPATVPGLQGPGGKPVYVPPKPYRVWIAPWYDDNGILHAGETTYFTSDGYWSMGTLKQKGQLSGNGFFQPNVNSLEKLETPAAETETPAVAQTPQVTPNVPVLPPLE